MADLFALVIVGIILIGGLMLMIGLSKALSGGRHGRGPRIRMGTSRGGSKFRISPGLFSHQSHTHHHSHDGGGSYDSGSSSGCDSGGGGGDSGGGGCGGGGD